MDIDPRTLDEEIDRELGWTDGSAKPRRSAAYWQRLLGGMSHTSRAGQFVGRMVRRFRVFFLFPLVSPLSAHRSYDVNGNLTVVKRSVLWRLADALLMRVLLTPVILGLFLMMMVWLTTHPSHIHAMQTPGGLNLVYKDVDLLTFDGHRLAAWYVPPMSADDVMISGEHVLDQKWPAVVVAHGLGTTHDVYLPMTRVLHEAGFAVLLLDLRGQGDSAPSAVTFGIRERLDVLAGVKYLRSLPAIDPMHVCVTGQGIGAAAALHAAALDSSIAAVVADGVWPSFDTRVQSFFDQPNAPTRWLAPLYEVTFEMMLRERLGELNLGGSVRSLSRQPVLFLAYPGSEQAPLAEVLALAESTAAPHQVIVAQDGQRAGDLSQARRITDFLTTTCHWVSPRARAREQINDLLKTQVK